VGLAGPDLLPDQKTVLRQRTAAHGFAGVVLLTWIVAGLLAMTRPLKMWAAPAVAMGVLVLVLPASMPSSVVHNKMPDQFMLHHLDALKPATALLSNDLGAASALAWRLRRPDVTLYNTHRRGQIRPDL
jgi:4-amino-4-deoxy-L-arabinose transferase